MSLVSYRPLFLCHLFDLTFAYSSLHILATLAIEVVRKTVEILIDQTGKSIITDETFLRLL
jgi:hypothetical protein